MLSRVVAVKAPRTHNRRRVTGSSGRRREGGESEPQRPNMSRRVFTSAVLLLFVVVMCCGTGAAKIAEVEPTIAREPVPKSPFGWRDTTGDETVSSLRGPSLVEVNGKVFAVAEAQCKEDPKSVFTGIASQLLSMEKGKGPEEVLKDAKYTQVLEEDISMEKKKVDVSRPTTVVKGNNIYMIVGKHSHEDAANCQAGTENTKSGILLVKGEVGGEADNNRIHWKETDGVPCTLGDQHESLSRLIGGGGSGVKLNEGTLVFPVEATKKKEKADTEEGGKTVSLVIYSLDAKSWTLSKGMSADGCSDPSVVEWKEKLMMMTACDGRRRVYEIGDKGNSWTEALGTLSRVWGNKKGEKVEIVRSGFITANIGGGVEDDKRNVMLVTLPVYSNKEDNPKGVLHLWLTDNTHIVDIGPVSGNDDDVTASSLLYKSGYQGNNDELIALYEKKKGEEESSLGMVSVRLTAQLKRVKEVLATWKEVDERVSELCPSEEDTSTENACNTGKITAGLVGFLSGNFSNGTWRDEYLGVNATVNYKDGAEEKDNGVTFKGRGAWAEWPVGRQGDNQLYHFANHNFTLVATVSIHDVPKEGSIPLMGATMNDSDNTVILGLSYNNNNENKWILLCGGRENKKYSSDWETNTSEHMVVLLRNGNQSSAYVDGQPVGGDEKCNLENTDSKGISHFLIGGDGGSAENTGGREGVPVTVSNVLLYNRPLTSQEIAELAKNKVTISKSEGPKTSVVDAQSSATSGSPVQGAVSLSNSARQLPLEEETLKENIGGAGGVSSAASVTTTPSSDVAQTVATGSGDTMQGIGSPQTPEVSVSSAEDAETAGRTDAQGEEGIHSHNGEVNATALNSSLGNLSQGNNSDAGTMCGSGLLPSLLLLGLWGFAAL
ncbi:putative trans-sialidase, Group V [Trypanosoma cruzi]|uniref:Trans-sialidase, putative n=2 Tax=Trypanosoma cruzi TaxID=5693 RepID=Q4DNF9_TRYCC|nr:trans-sialidase, putative [Trypanosoma cruzi]EAN94054.1 trans-sialidase, putative [Trypanosoma cruzi]PWV21195.1 putative trans-sialidase, Group V [Trypanosoma cruzi]|eukprot:XP_815905.1 trans-sialidase [Trypanosoma cruzi strain CL Brener]